jgi:hypothetical protein
MSKLAIIARKLCFALLPAATIARMHRWRTEGTEEDVRTPQRFAGLRLTGIRFPVFPSAISKPSGLEPARP